MRSAYWLVVYLLAATFLLESRVFAGGLGAEPENSFGWRQGFAQPFNLFGSRRIAGFTAIYSKETELTLYEAVTRRLGRPWRSRGTDDRGYDCSGLVWRVFHDAGIEFERSSARTLWSKLPDATRRERSQFGTLVFFKGLNHVGIVRDAYSFYHVSSSRGVVRSYFSDYWGDRVVGFRRAPAPLAHMDARPNAWRETASKGDAWNRWRVKGRK